jgi:hypothetical protein
MHSFFYNALGQVAYGTDTAVISAGVTGIEETLEVVGGASGGTIVLQGSQNVAGAATTTTLLQGSFGFLTITS